MILLLKNETKKLEIIRQKKSLEKERVLDEQIQILQERSYHLDNDFKEKLADITDKILRVEKEKNDIHQNQEELFKMIIAKEREIKRRKEGLEAFTDEMSEQYKKREKATLAEIEGFAQREQELEEEVEIRLLKVKNMEEVTKKEWLLCETREKNLAEVTNLTEVEREELEKKKEAFEQEVHQTELQLEQRERFTEAEMSELQNIREKLKEIAGLEEAEKRKLGMRRRKLVEEAKRREKELQERENMTEVQQEEVEFKEQVVRMEIERRLAELKLMEKITEDERLEIEQREQEIVRMTRVREIFLRDRQRNLQEAKKQRRESIGKECRDLAETHGYTARVGGHAR